MNLAGSLGPIAATLLLQYYDWRTVLTMSGTGCAAFAFVCLLFVKNEPKDVGLPNIEPAAQKGAKGGEFTFIYQRLIIVKQQHSGVWCWSCRLTGNTDSKLGRLVSSGASVLINNDFSGVNLGLQDHSPFAFMTLDPDLHPGWVGEHS